MEAKLKFFILCSMDKYCLHSTSINSQQSIYTKISENSFYPKLCVFTFLMSFYICFQRMKKKKEIS